MDDKNIDKPIPEVNLEEINLIVNKGVKVKKSFIGYLVDTIKTLGLKNIFNNKLELFLIFGGGIALLLFSILTIDESDIKVMYKFIFTVAPLMYSVIVIFSFYNTKEKGTFDIEMTCKYNLYQLTAIRMFIFSLATVALNTISILCVCIINGSIDAIRMITISITAVFLFSSIFLYSLIKLRMALCKYVVIVFWIGVIGLLNKIDSKFFNEFLIKAPLYVHLIISVICIGLYIKNLNRLINLRRKRGEI